MAISTVSAVLERRVWSENKGVPLYPNLYTFLVGPPGVGKSFILNVASDMLRETKVYIAPTSVSRASLTDALNDAKRDILIAGEHVSFNALYISISELGAFLPEYENAFMNTLTHLWDCANYEDRKRGADIRIHIPSPCLGLLAGTTPSFLAAMLPAGAWDQGFLARTLLVFDGQQPKSDPFQGIKLNAGIREDLEQDLISMSALYGCMEFADDAVEFIRQWHFEGGPPIPDHPRLIHYLTRRTVMLIKLSIIVSIAEGNDKVITGEHALKALAYQLAMEERIPDIFKSISSGGESNLIDEAYHYMYKLWSRRACVPVKEPELYLFLKNRTPSYTIPKIVETMIKAGMIKPTVAGGLPAYVPLPRDEFT